MNYNLKTRMHSSRMHTARRSSHPGGVSTRHPSQEQTPPDQAPSGSRPPRDQTPPCGQNHRRLWKYNLAPTSLRAFISYNKYIVLPYISNCELWMLLFMFTSRFVYIYSVFICVLHRWRWEEPRTTTVSSNSIKFNIYPVFLNLVSRHNEGHTPYWRASYIHL